MSSSSNFQPHIPPATKAVLGLIVVAFVGCKRSEHSAATVSRDAAAASTTGQASPPKPPRKPRPALGPLPPGMAYRYDGAPNSAVAISVADAEAQGLLVVDLSNEWAPFLFQDGAQPGQTGKPNDYRATFIALENDRNERPDVQTPAANFLEPYGIPPTLSVLRGRIETDSTPEHQKCEAAIDRVGLQSFTGNVAFLDRERARREYIEAMHDADWFEKEIRKREEAAAVTDAGADSGGAGGANHRVSPDAAAPRATWATGDRVGALRALLTDANTKVRLRAERHKRGQERVRAIRAAQARLMCEGLLSPKSRFVDGAFDLPTHEALAQWERKNDLFGWGQLGGETLTSLLSASAVLDFETFRRVLAERVADAAGIVEDGSAPSTAGVAVPNLIDEHVRAVLASVRVADADDLRDFLRQHGEPGLATLRVAIPAPPLPPYYQPEAGHKAMALSVEIDRGDIWYDFPFDSRGRPVEQDRRRFPHVTLFVTSNGKTIPLCSWRTTIGSWRSEMHANGKIYYKYKNSDVGPRVWKHIVAGPVWIPPDSTPVKDLLTRKVLDREKGSELVVNTDVMGPGFQSAYGLVMAIHINKGGFDNQIRTHGSVDYTSIARRFSHGCHRLVNNRAVRLFDFVLRRQAFRRIGAMPLNMKRTFVVDNKTYHYELKTRGYYYELENPISVDVTEGRIMGQVKQPIVEYVRKAGVDYSGVRPQERTSRNETESTPTEVQSAGDPSSGDSEARIDTPTEPVPVE